MSSLNKENIQEDIQDLLALAALDAIADRDRQVVEDLATDDPELETELRSLQTAANALAYAEPTLPVPASLKQRLFERIQPAQKSPEEVPTSPAFWSVRAAEVKWQPHSVQGVSIAILRDDPVKRLVSALVRCEAGAVYPSHRHAIGEEIFMLEGDLVDNGVTYTVGDFLYSTQDSVHAPSSTHGCVFLVRTSMDDVFV
ncbi:cupin domain-containing protein [Tumidithrix elongata RA019]|uniref:Cupin domain-containing protein n=1 Tax=Tumidithrix elongata BACA0141 TaxID=2716417 RepID=A0AAW9PVH1_9CYAN|nr:cupin domain-containing protein [Tumidithrix elongata RA019]